MTEELRVLKSSAAPLRDGNPEPRVPCILVLDRSGSTEGDPINQLNAALPTLGEYLRQDAQAAQRVELAVVTVGGDVQVAQDFVLPAEFKPPVLTAGGATPLGEGILKAIEMGEQRRGRYEASDLDSYEPWIFVISDGVPTDPREVWELAVRRAREAEARERGKRIVFYVVGVDGADMRKLAQISSRPPVKLRGLNFDGMFHWVSQNLTRASQTKLGDRVPLTNNPIAAGWAEA
jgi:uncharacterized protein YegL